jgi:hypothetical protein
MEAIQFIYNGLPVDFEPTGKDNVMVNATQMAKIFNAQVNEFTSNDKTKSFIAECLKNGNSRFISVETEEDLIISKQKSGTWMHRILALKFAAWLDPAFELWVFITIDSVIIHFYREQRDAMLEKLTIKARKEAKKKELLLKYPEMADYFDLEESEKDANYKRIASIREQFKQLKLEFKPSEEPQTC